LDSVIKKVVFERSPGQGSWGAARLREDPLDGPAQHEPDRVTNLLLDFLLLDFPDR
jgi:hypothetical protein